MPRDYLNLYSEKLDDRPLVTDFDPVTGRPNVVVGEDEAPVAEVEAEVETVVEPVEPAAPEDAEK